MRTFRARCHCGAIGYEYRTALAVAEWDVRSCQCGFCTRHGATTTSDPAGSVRFFFEEPGVLQRYRFGTGNTDFLICKRCGVYLGAVIETDAGAFATLNTRAMGGVAGIPGGRLVNYDDQSAQERLDRREKLFTPVTADSSGTESR